MPIMEVSVPGKTSKETQEHVAQIKEHQEKTNKLTEYSEQIKKRSEQYKNTRRSLFIYGGISIAIFFDGWPGIWSGIFGIFTSLAFLLFLWTFYGRGDNSLYKIDISTLDRTLKTTNMEKEDQHNMIFDTSIEYFKVLTADAKNEKFIIYKLRDYIDEWKDETMETIELMTDSAKRVIYSITTTQEDIILYTNKEIEDRSCLMKFTADGHLQHFLYLDELEEVLA